VNAVASTTVGVSSVFGPNLPAGVNAPPFSGSRLGYSASKAPSSEIAGWASAEVAEAANARAVMNVLNRVIVDLHFHFRGEK
jgi:hypothetical protein